jgi:aspartyl-tRNA(Asn)/glutamyl-tRNA(Gln) amidotransferase subunit C
MALSREDVRRIARLARLDLTEDEERLYAGQLSAILDFVKQLEELDVSGVEPMTHALAAGEPSCLRPDELRPGLSLDRALAAAPEREGPLFKVPRIIE